MSTAVPVPLTTIEKGHRRRAVFASTVGTTIEWYDFFLYGTAAALVFPKLYFPGQSEFVGVLAAFVDQRAEVFLRDLHRGVARALRRGRRSGLHPAGTPGG